MGFAQVKEESAARSGDTEQNPLPPRPVAVLRTGVIARLDPFKHHIPHTVPQLDAAVFKLGQRAVVRFGGVACQFRVLCLGAIFQARSGGEHF